MVPTAVVIDQGFRAERLRDLGLVKALSAEELRPEIVADSIRSHLACDKPQHNFDLNGTDYTLSFLE